MRGAHDARGLRRETKQQLDRRAGLAARAQLHHLTQQHQRHDDRRRLEIHRHRAHHAAHHGRENARQQHRHHAVAPRHADTQRDQGKHVEAAVDYGFITAPENRPAAPQYDRSGQDEFDPLQGGHRNGCGHDLRQQVGDHRHHEHRQGQRGADPETPGHIVQFSMIFRCGVARFQRHAAFRATARRGAHNFGVHRTGIFDRARHQRSFRLQSHAALRAASRRRLADFRVHRAGVHHPDARHGSLCRVRLKVIRRCCLKLCQAFRAAKQIGFALVNVAQLGVGRYRHAAHRIFIGCHGLLLPWLIGEMAGSCNCIHFSATISRKVASSAKNACTASGSNCVPLILMISARA